ncbi:hypothetical protein HPB48_017678 [Haemaphysalis longicornis]|uniref:Uncharacterized protein n=1 Tax=Haemaphysalis longicornis TaxID=44386 RepID=A0A9J6GM08_HAELO|nr:hypothetical protein HPB48_017678 [Haemaphysalis longicornis]
MHSLRASQLETSCIPPFSPRGRPRKKTCTDQLEGSPSSATANDTISDLTSKIKVLSVKCDESENRLLPSNLIFFGLPDADGETWHESEGKIVSFCFKNLSLNNNISDIERAHIQGRFRPRTKRPIINKLTQFKDKSKILSSGPRPKGTSFSIPEDFSERTRLAQKKLRAHGNQSNASFKIGFDRITIGDKHFLYNA